MRGTGREFIGEGHVALNGSRTNGSPSAIEAKPLRGPADAVAAAAAALLGQCAGLVECVGDDAYGSPSQTIRGGTIGKHIRHVLDHFRAAAEAADGRTIDYDRRERDVPMETDRRLALAAIAELTGLITRLDSVCLGLPVRVRVMVDADGAMVELHSTLARELAFATHHAVHHHAMVRAIAAEFGCAAPDDMGHAPSTLNHNRGAGAATGGARSGG
jgi:hypothetical protein